MDPAPDRRGFRRSAGCACGGLRSNHAMLPTRCQVHPSRVRTQIDGAANPHTPSRSSSALTTPAALCDRNCTCAAHALHSSTGNAHAATWHRGITFTQHAAMKECVEGGANEGCREKTARACRQRSLLPPCQLSRDGGIAQQVQYNKASAVASGPVCWNDNLTVWHQSTATLPDTPPCRPRPAPPPAASRRPEIPCAAHMPLRRAEH